MKCMIKYLSVAVLRSCYNEAYVIHLACLDPKNMRLEWLKTLCQEKQSIY